MMIAKSTTDLKYISWSPINLLCPLLACIASDVIKAGTNYSEKSPYL